jgi:hypothetical protein
MLNWLNTNSALLKLNPHCGSDHFIINAAWYLDRKSVV